ncbi:MAG: flagellar basal body rod protein FlgB [Clostridiales bacterium]
MFFQNKSFKTMETGVSAAWLQQKIHTQNLANYDTPGYKAKSLVFNEVFTRAIDGGSKDGSALKIKVIENNDTSIRPDGNNVDMDSESISLYKAYVHYSMLLDKVKSEINNYNYVVNNAPK